MTLGPMVLGIRKRLLKFFDLKYFTFNQKIAVIKIEQEKVRGVRLLTFDSDR